MRDGAEASQLVLATLSMSRGSWLRIPKQRGSHSSAATAVEIMDRGRYHTITCRYPITSTRASHKVSGIGGHAQPS